MFFSCVPFSFLKRIFVVTQVADLILSLSDQFSSMGFCWVDKSGEMVRMQHGIIRTNCVDCLDRTNVVQVIFFVYSSVWLCFLKPFFQKNSYEQNSTAHSLKSVLVCNFTSIVSYTSAEARSCWSTDGSACDTDPNVADHVGRQWRCSITAGMWYAWTFCCVFRKVPFCFWKWFFSKRLGEKCLYNSSMPELTH